GADVDRQEADAVGGRASHAAVERPRGRVDAERQAVDVGTGDDRASGLGAPVGIERDREQQSEVRERCENDQPAGQHRWSVRGSSGVRVTIINSGSESALIPPTLVAADQPGVRVTIDFNRCSRTEIWAKSMVSLTLFDVTPALG